MFWPKRQQETLFVGLWLALLLGLLQPQNVNGLIVPEQLTSFLSLVYSNIPPIKKGTDSRLGFGFRLGDHADFQVLLELGPQKDTQPLGDPNKEDQSFNKRQVSAIDQRAQLRRQQQLQQQQSLLTSTERNAASWLESWSNGMKPLEAKPKTKLSSKQRAKLALPVQKQMPTDAVQQLQLLYKMAATTTTTTTTTPTPTTIKVDFLKLPPPALEQNTNALGLSRSTKKSQAELTEELMNVSLEA
ncbi:uncharacterized protein LOC6562631 [Drosophila grimshawi]|uniref:GH10105 n=1 Tax=Drosophila grimshawi TaxID=7222 RepID=B4JCQ6_DROGR|nr:uncharacterized protein LOC6562631 [Drosophila grimshawi]EDW04220.1 GH10105 [Drosophila grimshawi]